MSLGFIDVTAGLANHHFCEPAHSFEDQWSSGDVWLWNLGLTTSDGSDTSTLVGQSMTDVNGTVYMGQAPGDSESNYVNGSDPFGFSEPIPTGWVGRPFHPKRLGHGAIKDIIIARLRRDGVPGVLVPALSL